MGRKLSDMERAKGAIINYLSSRVTRKGVSITTLERILAPHADHVQTACFYLQRSGHLQPTSEGRLKLVKYTRVY